MSNPARPAMPTWVMLPLREPVTPSDLVAKLGHPRARLDADGIIRLGDGFLAWIDARPLPPHLINGSASKAPPTGGACTLHITGGTNAETFQRHEISDHARAALAEALDRVADTGSALPRVIVSEAAKHVAEMTDWIVRLLPYAEGLVLPHANDMAFSAAEFLERAKDFTTPQRYHFPLYTFYNGRLQDDGPYMRTVGMWIFGLPDIAMPVSEDLEPDEATEALGELQREMVAEGWWPRTGDSFTVEQGELHLIRTATHGLIAVPVDVEFDDEAVARATYRFSRERLWVEPGMPSIVHRVTDEDGLVTDHHLAQNGDSCVITSGLAFVDQEGGTPQDENDRVELAIVAPTAGSWCTGWLSYIAGAITGGDGSHPYRAFDRIVMAEPMAGIAGCILWPRGDPKAFDGLDQKVNLWVLVPFLTEELAAFRARPGAQEEWMRAHQPNLDVLSKRWERAITR